MTERLAYCQPQTCQSPSCPNETALQRMTRTAKAPPSECAANFTFHKKYGTFTCLGRVDYPWKYQSRVALSKLRAAYELIMHWNRLVIRNSSSRGLCAPQPFISVLTFKSIWMFNAKISHCYCPIHSLALCPVSKVYSCTLAKARYRPTTCLYVVDVQ